MNEEEKLLKFPPYKPPHPNIIRDGKLWGQFEVITEAEYNSFSSRLSAIKARSEKGYIDDGCMGLYIALIALAKKGYWRSLKAALEEIEGLYALKDQNAETIWEGMLEAPFQKKRRKDSR